MSKPGSWTAVAISHTYSRLRTHHWPVASSMTSARFSISHTGRNWDLRCAVREGLITFLKQSHPEALPRLRIDPQDVDPSPNPLAALQ